MLEQDPELSFDAQALAERLYDLVKPLKGALNKKRGGRGENDLTLLRSQRIKPA